MEDFKMPTSITRPPEHDVNITSQEKGMGSNASTKELTADKFPNTTSAIDAKCPYIEPKWSSTPNPKYQYKFEVLKSGTIVEEIADLQNKPFWVFGRLSNNDIVMAHPTISRFHAVLQYRTAPENINGHPDSSESQAPQADNKFGDGWYLYDLGSTHGSFVNKMQVPPKTYIPVKVGHMITLGASTRKYILQGPEFDEEPESELTITELRERRAIEEEERRRYAELQEELREKEGINWGMSEDADEETDLSVNPYASTNNEELFFDDPKKTLRGFFEREGLDLEYNVEEMSLGTFVCRIELPLDDAEGKPITVEVCHKGKKKECVLQCALEACRTLDRHGVLRQSHHEPMKRRAPKSDSDDDDDFLDRTGDVEKKKLRKANASQSDTLTYEDLVKQELELSEKISTVKSKINRYQEETRRSKQKEATQSEDDLDDYMNNLSYEKEIDKAEIRKLRLEEQRLLNEQQKLQRLIKITKPVQLPSLDATSEDKSKKKSFLPLFGKRNKNKLPVSNKVVATKTTVSTEYRSDEEEMEDDEINAMPPTISQPELSSILKDSISTTDNELTTAVESKDDGKNIFPSPDISKSVKGPAFIPQKFVANKKETLSSISQSDNSITVAYDEENDEADEEDCKEESETSEEASSTSKKRRNRNRNRAKGRENVDIDDKAELTDKEKYSGWIPPQNQTGDGMTVLNKKFGY